jgi:hypothetical protein
VAHEIHSHNVIRKQLLDKRKRAQAAYQKKMDQQDVAEGAEKRCMQCGMKNCTCAPGKCKCKPVAGWVPGKGFKKAMDEAALNEKWSEKYKSSINCSHPKGFSQKAHCAGKKKHNEDMTMEMVCPECGMCQTHGDLNEIKKGAKDANGFTRCWPGKHAVGTKKGKNGGQVRNCQPNEGADPYFESLSNSLAEKLDPNAPVDVWVQDFAKADPEKYHQFRQNNRPGTRKPEKKIERMAQAASYAAKTGK